jgi:hypothetical protein
LFKISPRYHRHYLHNRDLARFIPLGLWIFSTNDPQALLREGERCFVCSLVYFHGVAVRITNDQRALSTGAEDLHFDQPRRNKGNPAALQLMCRSIYIAGGISCLILEKEWV